LPPSRCETVRCWLAEDVIGGSRPVEGERRAVVIGGGEGEDTHRSLLVRHVQQAPRSVHCDRRRASSKTGAARQHGSAAAATPPLTVQPVDLLVVQVGDEHVTGSGVDRDGRREEGTVIAAVGRWTPAPQSRVTVTTQTRHLTQRSCTKRYHVL